MRLRPSPFSLVVLSCIFGLPASAQQASTVVTQNPTAISLARNSVAVLCGSVQISDITLTGTATRVAGSDTGSGTVTLKALGTSSSRMDMSLSNGTFSEIRNASGGTPQGSWITPDGVSHAMANHNTFTDAAWFVPQLSVLSQLSNPNLVVTYVGSETRSGTSVQHLHFAFQSSTADPTGLFQLLSAEEVYLNSSTFLPVAIVFNAHPDNDASSNIAVEIDFSAYQSVNGVLVPFQIQKLINNGLVLDLTIDSAKINQGLTAADFS